MFSFQRLWSMVVQLNFDLRSILYNLRKRKHHFFNTYMLYLKETNKKQSYNRFILIIMVSIYCTIQLVIGLAYLFHKSEAKSIIYQFLFCTNTWAMKLIYGTNKVQHITINLCKYQRFWLTLTCIKIQFKM